MLDDKFHNCPGRPAHRHWRWAWLNGFLFVFQKLPDIPIVGAQLNSIAAPIQEAWPKMIKAKKMGPKTIARISCRVLEHCSKESYMLLMKMLCIGKTTNHFAQHPKYETRMLCSLHYDALDLEVWRKIKVYSVWQPVWAWQAMWNPRCNEQKGDCIDTRDSLIWIKEKDLGGICAWHTESATKSFVEHSVAWQCCQLMTDQNLLLRPMRL